MPGFFLGNFLQQSLQLRVIRLVAQVQISPAGLELMGNGQLNGLNNVNFRHVKLLQILC